MKIITSAIIVESNHELWKKSLPYYFLENTQRTYFLDEDRVPQSFQEMETEHIKKVLTLINMNKTKVSKILGICRVNLIAKIKKYELE